MKYEAKYRLTYEVHFPDGSKVTRSGEYISEKSVMHKVAYLMHLNENGAHYENIEISAVH